MGVPQNHPSHWAIVIVIKKIKTTMVLWSLGDPPAKSIDMQAIASLAASNSPASSVVSSKGGSRSRRSFGEGK